APAAMAPSPTTAPTVSAVEAGVTAVNDVALTNAVAVEAVRVLRSLMYTHSCEIGGDGGAQARLIHRVGDRAAQGITVAMERTCPVERLAPDRAGQGLVDV